MCKASIRGLHPAPQMEAVAPPRSPPKCPMAPPQTPPHSGGEHCNFLGDLKIPVKTQEFCWISSQNTPKILLLMSLGGGWLPPPKGSGVGAMTAPKTVAPPLTGGGGSSHWYCYCPTKLWNWSEVFIIATWHANFADGPRKPQPDVKGYHPHICSYHW